VDSDFDVIVVGAGCGGIYAVYRLREQGLSVLGLEGASGVGGVWYHNRYPGARVDVDSIDYSYYFSPEVWQKWRWSERFASQPELLAYLNFVADTCDVKRHFCFDTWMTAAQWDPESCRYRVTSSNGSQVTGRFLLMCTGNLSRPRRPEFPGLDRFQGEWVQTSHWPDREVVLDGRRIGSPSVLANMILQNEYHIDWIADCIAYLDAQGYSTIEPTEQAQDDWSAHVAQCASKLLRLKENNYMVHVNSDDGSRVFIPYTGGLSAYVNKAREVATAGYQGFRCQ
jgi:NAD(P)-binding Rossmann-like domain